jgi:rhodanese-related sulfurtransferase
MMEELNKTNRLTMIVSAILLVIIIGLISFRRPDVKYVLSPAESLTLLNNPALLVTPDQLALMLKDSSGKTVLIDVRNSIAYERGHISNAINIPVRELFSRKNKAFFKEIEKSGQVALLYGETQQQANGPWLMLHQTGFKNVKLFTGNYAQLNLAKADSLTKILPQLSETPLIDIAALKLISSPADKSSEASQADKTVKKTVSPVKKISSSGGGC